MDRVKLDLGFLDLDGHFHLVVGLRHRLELPDGVGGEAPPLGPVVQHQPLGRLVIHKVGRSTDSETSVRFDVVTNFPVPGIGEFEVFVKVVQTIEKITQLTAQKRQHVSVSNIKWNLCHEDILTFCSPVLCGKLDKEISHSLEKLIRITAKCSEGFLGKLSQKLLRVNLGSTTSVMQLFM